VGVTSEWESNDGPTRLTDMMEVTEWKDGSTIR
jgi:hypothetical protein